MNVFETVKEKCLKLSDLLKLSGGLNGDSHEEKLRELNENFVGNI